MGHEARARDSRCDILDELEAAITLKNRVRVYLAAGRSQTGTPQDVFTKDKEDWLQLENHQLIPISEVIRVERLL